jgi:predicted transcriptional regulator
MGALENQVLKYLWTSGRPVAPREVREGLDLNLAYTTVLTILRRLWQKGLAEREQRGRVYLYRPKLDEADYVAGAMRRQMERAGDHSAVLSRFVGTLSEQELHVLRDLLDDGQ